MRTKYKATTFWFEKVELVLCNLKQEFVRRPSYEVIRNLDDFLI